MSKQPSTTNIKFNVLPWRLRVPVQCLLPNHDSVC